MRWFITLILLVNIFVVDVVVVLYGCGLLFVTVVFKLFLLAVLWVNVLGFVMVEVLFNCHKPTANSKNMAATAMRFVNKSITGVFSFL
jgi:hypothetical protein